MFNAENRKFYIDDTYIDYLVFGNGQKIMVIIAGLSTLTIGGMALPMAVMYRKFAKEYRVYVIDRRADLPPGCTIEQMAEDTIRVMDSLQIKSADVIGVSQGGMIAQCIAIRRPDLVRKLVLAVTASEANYTIKESIDSWVDMVEKGKNREFAADMMYRMYSDKYISKYRLFIPVLSAMQKNINKDRFIIQCKAIADFDITAKLKNIQRPILVIGAENDKVVTAEASEQIAAITGAELYIYEKYGHAVYDEAKDFNKRISDFLKK